MKRYLLFMLLITLTGCSSLFEEEVEPNFLDYTSQNATTGTEDLVTPEERIEFARMLAENPRDDTFEFIIENFADATYAFSVTPEETATIFGIGNEDYYVSSEVACTFIKHADLNSLIYVGCPETAEEAKTNLADKNYTKKADSTPESSYREYEEGSFLSAQEESFVVFVSFYSINDPVSVKQEALFSNFFNTIHNHTITAFHVPVDEMSSLHTKYYIDRAGTFLVFYEDKVAKYSGLYQTKDITRETIKYAAPSLKAFVPEDE